MDFNTPFKPLITPPTIIISATVVQIFTGIVSANRIFMSKIKLATMVTQCWIPPTKSANLINTGNGDMSRNGSHPYCYSDNLYGILHRDFPFYITGFNETLKENLSLSFSLRKDITSYLKLFPATLLQTKKNKDGNEQKTQQLFIS